MDFSKEVRAGAGGQWPRHDERFNAAIVKQVNDASCVAAAGEMLATAYSVNCTQEEIRSEIGDLANSELLIEFLDRRDRTGLGWGGGILDASENEAGIRALLSAKPAFLAILREGTPLGHAVIVRGIGEHDLVRIEDPYDQSAYNMQFPDFIEVFSEVVSDDDKDRKISRNQRRNLRGNLLGT